MTLVGGEPVAALARRFPVPCRAGPGSHGVEVRACERLDVVRREHAEVEQPTLDLVEQVGVGLLREQGRLEVRLEGLLDLVGLVAKSRTIVPCLPGWVRFRRDSVWTAFTPPSFLSTYIVWSRRLVEPGLELVGDH